MTSQKDSLEGREDPVIVRSLYLYGKNDIDPVNPFLKIQVDILTFLTLCDF